jgi:hypothetical protein
MRIVRTNGNKFYFPYGGQPLYQLGEYVACQSYTKDGKLREMSPEIDFTSKEWAPTLINRRRIIFEVRSLSIIQNQQALSVNDYSIEEKNKIIIRDKRWVESNFPQEILQALRDDKIDLYINHAVEGWNDVDFESLCKIFNIKPTQLVWVTSLYNTDRTMPIPNKLGVRVVFDNFWEKHLARYMTDEQGGDEKFQKQIRCIEEKTPRTMLATMYARRVRTPRTFLVALMHEYNLLDKIHWSYGIEIEGNQVKERYKLPYGDIVGHMKKLNKRDGGLLFKDESIDWVSSLTKNQYADKHRLEDNLAHGKITWPHTYNTKMMIINETQPGSDVDWRSPDVDAKTSYAPFLSEKSYKPFYAGQPFVMWGDVNTVSALQEEGYRVFHGWINHSYDCIVDSTERLRTLSLEIKRLSELSEEVWTNMLIEMLPDIKHNRELLSSTHNSNHALLNV